MASVEAQVANVFRRLGFGPAASEIQAAVPYGPQAVIEYLCALPATTETDWAWPARGDWTEVRAYKTRLLELMATSPNPVQERVAWILTGLLVIATQDNIGYPEMKAHFNLLRSGALGSYPELLFNVTVSTGMQWYLDGINSTREHPNEYLARELCELFSLGVTHPITGARNYTESDVKEIARALTGYRFDWNTSHAYFDERRWDGGNKAIFGIDRGPARASEVLQAVFSHPSAPYFVPRRVYRELTGLEPDAAVLQELAVSWGGSLRELVRAIARRPEFLSDAAVGSRVKCPVELVVGALRVLGLRDLERFSLDWRLSEMQQDPFKAPNVSGWPQGADWLHAGHLLQWSRTLQGLCWADNGSASVPPERQCPTIRQLFALGSRDTGGDLALWLAGLHDVSPETRQAARQYAGAGTWTFNRACGLMNLVLLSPEYLVTAGELPDPGDRSLGDRPRRPIQRRRDPGDPVGPSVVPERGLPPGVQCSMAARVRPTGGTMDSPILASFETRFPLNPVMAKVFPAAFWEQELAAALFPFQLRTFYATPSFRRLLV